MSELPDVAAYRAQKTVRLVSFAAGEAFAFRADAAIAALELEVEKWKTIAERFGLKMSTLEWTLGDEIAAYDAEHGGDDD